MAYFVTGATGFIGRHLVERLLERDGDIHVLVRAGSQDRLSALVARWGDRATQRVKPVVGDLAEPRLGLSDEQIAALRGQIEHFFHLAAIYDMTAPEEANERLNVAGTRNAVELVNALSAGHLHHVSSVAAAGEFKGLFREDMFDEGQRLPSAYHRTKFESEKIVREQAKVPWRVYRPAIVVGHSQTGEMDKIDGPYYFFKAIQKARFALPEWFPLIGPELGYTNIVPVDFVAAALDHIAHQPAMNFQAFHLTNPKPMRVGESLNAFAGAAHAPKLAIRVDKRLTDALPKGTLSMLMKLPQLRDIRRTVLADFGIPEEVVDHMALKPQFDTRDTERALAGSGIEVPELGTYADKLWDYWERSLDPDLFRDRSFEHIINGRTVIITGASSGIGRATALKVAAAGGIPLLVARGIEKLEALREEIEAAGGTAHVYSADLSDMDAIDDHARHGPRARRGGHRLQLAVAADDHRDRRSPEPARRRRGDGAHAAAGDRRRRRAPHPHAARAHDVGQLLHRRRGSDRRRRHRPERVRVRRRGRPPGRPVPRRLTRRQPPRSRADGPPRRLALQRARSAGYAPGRGYAGGTRS